ncbi:MAG: NUDIX domain-containing protein [Alphaproteobacteria bacterium]|jgi:8-oxo-dGTP pyrophosphatase MutT (NUDIX family)|nr:NUDIX domain-containing protein [Alphaproteobacteria bacterium]
MAETTKRGPNAYDKPEDGEVLIRDRPSPRPRDAATLILVRRDQAAARVLMGMRSGQHAFMPKKYVFPGGRVDPPDGRAPSLTELPETEHERLEKAARRRPRAFPLTAIRETFEETGLIVGRAGQVDGKPPQGWETYYGRGAAPCLQGFQLIGRAVTPPYRPRRYDARFFMALAEESLIDERPPVDGAELSDLQWVTLDDAMALDIPSVTRFMLGEIKERLEQPQRVSGAPFLKWTRSGHAVERL